MTETIQPAANTTPPAAVARKRRREILSSQRLSSSACNTSQLVSLESQDIIVDVSIPLPPISSCPTEVKKRKVEETPPITTSHNKTTPKPKISKKKANTQMRYDPEVPMTKEEAAAWRREARRVRNRESAAASRQKTRDRIVQLEGEVDVWKKKYEEIMSKLQRIEGGANSTLEHEQSQSWSDSKMDSSFVSPCSSPSRSPELLPSLLLCASSFVETNRSRVEEPQEKVLYLNETISRPAVKKTGTATSIPNPHPDSIVSATTEVLPTPLVIPDTGATEDGDLEDFLLDALEGLEQEKEMFSVPS